jgi:transcriptional regulator with XRE-family HTH domain
MDYETDEQAAPPHPERLRDMRLASGMTEAELGAYLQLTPELISRFEQGLEEASVPLVMRWIRACNGLENDVIVVVGAARLRNWCIRRLDDLNLAQLKKLKAFVDALDAREGKA